MPDFLSPQPVSMAFPNATTTGPATPAAPAYPSYGPTFQDVMSRLNGPLAGADTFQKGIANATPTQGVSPELQTVLDNIKSNQSFNTDAGTSAASALASRRGLAGSSVEQFGVTNAANDAARTAQDQSTSVLLADAARKQAMQDMVTKGYFDRAGAEGTAGTTMATTGANLTSDEIASLRNQQFQQQQLTLQQQLGQEGIDVANRNIDASKQIAQQNGTNSLIGAGLGAILPSLIPHLFPSASGVGGTAATIFDNTPGVGTGAFAPYSPGGLPGPYAAGTGAVPGATAGFTPGLGSLAAAGAGAMILSKAAENKYGTAAGIVANPIGYQLNKAKDIISSGGNVVSNAASSIGKAVSSVFPF